MYKVAKLNSKFSDHYINIARNDNLICYGGNQGWWQDQVITGDDMGHRRRLKADKYYRLWKIGCGIIAMCDAELYLTLQNSNYSLSVSATFDETIRRTGLYPWTMISGFRGFLKANGSSRINVKWARYGKAFGVVRKQKILAEIERMLNEDIPVVCSYHTCTKGDNIILYDTIQEAKNNVSKKSDPANTDSHYMTIVGLYKYSDGQPWNYKYILEVVSWGQAYYINYEMYAKKLDYFSNVLSVF